MGWKEFVVGWLVFFLLPKLTAVPIARWMWRSWKASQLQDEIDAVWLAEIERRRQLREDEGGTPVPRFRPRPPRRPDPTRTSSARRRFARKES